MTLPDDIELRQDISDIEMYTKDGEAIDFIHPEHLDKIMELVNKYNGTVDLTKPKVNLIDIASPNMTPEASKVVSDALERSAEVMNRVTTDHTGGNQMTNYNERLDEALCNYRGRVLTYHELYRKQHHSPRRLDEDLAYADVVAKQALTSLIKELVAEAKPANSETQRGSVTVYGDLSERDLKIVNQFEQNLLKALEEV